MKYLNPTTNQTAVCNSTKADKDGNVWVEIDGQMPVKMHYDAFIGQFHAVASDTSRRLLGAVSVQSCADFTNKPLKTTTAEKI